MTNSPYNFVSDERLEQLQSWLAAQGYRTDTLAPLSADAGFRRYFRLQTDSGTRVAVDAPPEYEDCKAFVDIANQLRNCGLLTPTVHCYNLEKGFMLLSDLGSQHLQDVASPSDTESAQPFYLRAIDTLITMQRQAPSDNLPAYSADFLHQELSLFPQWYLGRHLNYKCSTAEKKQIQLCFDRCIASACEQPQVFVHRDYHCRNLMIQPDNEIAVIDFQGALRGPITYDLVSLLRDAYVEWPETFLQPLLDQHYDSLKKTLSQVNSSNSGGMPDRQQYQQWFDLTGLQRHLKILGIFSRLHYRDGKSHYLDSIPLVQKHVVDVCSKYPELSALEDLLLQFMQKQSPAGAG